MAILIYQIGIFAAIQISSMFGKSPRNAVIILIALFTVLQVFTSGLMILQFLTIFTSTYFSNRWFFKKQEEDQRIKSEIKNTQNFTDKIARPNKVFQYSDTFYDDNDGFSSITMGGISKDSAILMNCEESKENYIKKLLSVKAGLSAKKTAKHFVNNYEVDEYHFYYNDEYFASLYVTTNSSHSYPLLPAFFKKEYLDRFVN